MTPQEALQEALATVEGSPSALAAKLGDGVTRQNVEYWVKKGRVPAEYCPAIERATSVRCEDLRPDVAWGVLRDQAASAPATVAGG